MGEFYTYKGAIHIHTKLSDGTGDINSVSKAAKKAGLDFIIITDHNHYDNDEGIINGVYVIKAEEISPKDCNHYLTFGLNETILPDDNPQNYVDKVRIKGGFGFAAHPNEGYSYDKDGNIYPRKNSNHCIPWTDKNIKPDGIEIWNWFSNWADNLDDSNILSLAYAYLFKHNIITPPSKLTLEWWDKLNNESKDVLPALGGVDAHALKFYRYIVPVTVFPYETCFKTITNNIYLSNALSDIFSIAKEQILTAIKNGNNTIINRKILDKLPEIYVENLSGKYYVASNITLDENTSLHFVSNKMLRVCLIYNGNVICDVISDNFSHKIENAGKYRIEAYYRGRGYLYTNPFNIVK